MGNGSGAKVIRALWVKDFRAEQVRGYTTFGSGTTEHGLEDDGDVLISGNLEVASVAFFEGSTYLKGSLYFVNVNPYIRFGASDSYTSFYGSSAYDHFLIGVGELVGRQVIIADGAYRAKNHNHGTQTNPTLFVHSAEDPDTDNTQWVSLTHDQSNGVLLCGKGNIIQDAKDAATADGELEASQMSFYLDETANAVTVKVKYADGSTVKTGTIALT